jgi:hypothetical protein
MNSYLNNIRKLVVIKHLHIVPALSLVVARPADTSCMELNCTLKNKISIGSRVIVGCGAAVINDVSDEDIVAAVPAKSIKDKVSSEQLFLMAGQHQ